MNEHHADPPDVNDVSKPPLSRELIERVHTPPWLSQPDPEYRTTRCEGCDHEFAAHLVTDDFCADCAKYFCPECGEYRPDDARAPAKMRCGECADAAAGAS